MYFSDIVKLRAVTHSIDADGYHAQTQVETTVYGNLLSAGRAEFYAANANGIDVSAVVQVHTEDYSNQTELEVNSKVYDIRRTYQKGLGIIELVCSDKAV